MLQPLSPDPKNYSVFLLSTGSEATENCIKMAKTYAVEKYGPQKRYFVSFQNAFHGRTMGAQLAGGMQKQKKWLAMRPLLCASAVPGWLQEREYLVRPVS